MRGTSCTSYLWGTFYHHRFSRFVSFAECTVSSLSFADSKWMMRDRCRRERWRSFGTGAEECSSGAESSVRTLNLRKRWREASGMIVGDEGARFAAITISGVATDLRKKFRMQRYFFAKGFRWNLNTFSVFTVTKLKQFTAVAGKAFDGGGSGLYLW